MKKNARKSIHLKSCKSVLLAFIGFLCNRAGLDVLSSSVFVLVVEEVHFSYLNFFFVCLLRTLFHILA